MYNDDFFIVHMAWNDTIKYEIRHHFVIKYLNRRKRILDKNM